MRPTISSMPAPKRKFAQVKRSPGLRKEDSWGNVLSYSALGVSLLSVGAVGYYHFGRGLVVLGAGVFFLLSAGWLAWLLRTHGRDAPAGGGRESPKQKSLDGSEAAKVPPGTACYQCLRSAAQSQCGGCKRVFYCSEACQRAAWKGGHRVPCRAARAAEGREGPTSLRSGQVADVEGYKTLVRHLLDPYGPLPADEVSLIKILHSLGEFLRTHPELLSRDVADRLWLEAAARPPGGEQQAGVVATWSWLYLEESLQAGGPDGFLAGLGLRRFTDPGGGGAADRGRLLAWTNGPLAQALLMVTKRHFAAKPT